MNCDEDKYISAIQIRKEKKYVCGIIYVCGILRKISQERKEFRNNCVLTVAKFADLKQLERKNEKICIAISGPVSHINGGQRDIVIEKKKWNRLVKFSTVNEKMQPVKNAIILVFHFFYHSLFSIILSSYLIPKLN